MESLEGTCCVLLLGAECSNGFMAEAVIGSQAPLPCKTYYPNNHRQHGLTARTYTFSSRKPRCTQLSLQAGLCKLTWFRTLVRGLEPRQNVKQSSKHEKRVTHTPCLFSLTTVMHKAEALCSASLSNIVNSLFKVAIYCGSTLMRTILVFFGPCLWSHVLLVFVKFHDLHGSGTSMFIHMNLCGCGSVNFLYV